MSAVQRLIEVLQLQPQLVHGCTLHFDQAGGFGMSVHRTSWRQAELLLTGLGLPIEPLEIAQLDGHPGTICGVHVLGDEYRGGIQVVWFSDQAGVQAAYGPPEVWASRRRGS